MEPEEEHFLAEEYVRTTTNNLVSRKATVHGPQNVSLKGKGIVMAGVTLHGDLAPIRFGRYCRIGESTLIRPGARVERVASASAAAAPSSPPSPPSPGDTATAGGSGGDGSSGGVGGAAVELSHAYTPMLVGNHTRIGRDCVVEAAAIGSNVIIEDGCVLGANCIIKDNCVLEAHTLVPAGAVVPPFSRVRGRPGRLVGELPDSVAFVHPERAVAAFNMTW